MATTPYTRVSIASGDVLTGLRDWCAEQTPPVTEGAIVSVIGAVDTYAVSTVDPERDGDCPARHGRRAEIVASGEISAGQPHLHGVFASHGGVTVDGGHVEAAQVAVGLFVNAYIIRS